MRSLHNVILFFSSGVVDIYKYPRHQLIVIASLSNDDCNVNENGKKVTGLAWQNNNFTRASCFFVHFFKSLPSLHDYDVKCLILRGGQTQDNDFLFLFLNFDAVQKKLPTFNELNEME